MTLDEVLRDVRGFAGAGRIMVTAHAYERMGERGVTYQDLTHALKGAADAKPTNKLGRWKVTGTDLDGDELACVVVLEDGVIVVTVF